MSLKSVRLHAAITHQPTHARTHPHHLGYLHLPLPPPYTCAEEQATPQATPSSPLPPSLLSLPPCLPTLTHTSRNRLPRPSVPRVPRMAAGLSRVKDRVKEVPRPIFRMGSSTSLLCAARPEAVMRSATPRADQTQTGAPAGLGPRPPGLSSG